MNNKQNVLKLLVLLVFVLLFSSTEIMAQGLKASGKKIVDDKGNEVILRGMGPVSYTHLDVYKRQG